MAIRIPPERTGIEQKIQSPESASEFSSPEVPKSSRKIRSTTHRYPVRVNLNVAAVASGTVLSPDKRVLATLPRGPGKEENVRHLEGVTKFSSSEVPKGLVKPIPVRPSSRPSIAAVVRASGTILSSSASTAAPGSPRGPRMEEPEFSSSEVPASLVKPVPVRVGSSQSTAAVVSASSIIPSPKERILLALETEGDFTPLKLCFLKNKAFLIDAAQPSSKRLEFVCDWMRELYYETKHQKAPFSGLMTLQQLRKLQKKILEHNLKTIGRLWPRRCDLFMSVDKVRRWLSIYPGELQDQSNSLDFCKTVTHSCTFIPHEVARVITDDQWKQIGNDCLFAMDVESLWVPKKFLVCEIVTWKSDVLHSNLWSWAIRACEFYPRWRHETERIRFGEIVEVFFSEPERITKNQYVACFTNLIRGFRVQDMPLLRKLLSLFEETPTDSFTPDQWKFFGEAALFLETSDHKWCPVFPELLARKKEPFYPHWGMFAIRACEFYPRWQNKSECDRFREIVEVFLSEPELIATDQLVACSINLIQSFRLQDISLLCKFLQCFVGKRSLKPDERKQVGEGLSHIIIETIRENPNSEVLPRLFKFVSSDGLRRCVYKEMPVAAKPCIRSLGSNLPLLRERTRVFKTLERFMPRQFIHDVAAHQLSVQSWQESWARHRPPTPPPSSSDYDSNYVYWC